MEPDPRTPPDPPLLRESVLVEYAPPDRPADRDRIWLHVLLFVATFASMLIAGISLAGRAVAYAEGGWQAMLWDGMAYTVPFLLFLTVHEFGHYFAARWHGVRVSLPYYLPIPLPGSLGTFGAVIRIREPIRRTRQLFDIGAAGPIAGWLVALGVIVGAVLTLPPVEYLLTVGGPAHELVVRAFQATGAFPATSVAVPVGSGGVVFGDTVLFSLLQNLGAYRVPGYEIMHYPVLMAGWLGLFFTALNLLPVGQLDGGHIVYALLGPAIHRVVARIVVLLLLVSGAIGFLRDMVPLLSEAGLPAVSGWAVLALILLVYLRRFFGADEPQRAIVGALVGTPILLALAWLVTVAAPGLAAMTGYWGWLLWTGLILFFIRLDHPPVLVQEPLTPARVALGWFCIALFVLCFSLQPIRVL